MESSYLWDKISHRKVMQSKKGTDLLSYFIFYNQNAFMEHETVFVYYENIEFSIYTSNRFLKY